MTLNSSSLPSLDDLHSKARLSRVIFPNQYLPLDTNRLQPNPTNGQINAQSGVRVSPAYIGPETDVQCTSELLRDCTTVFRCTRFKSGLPTYRPIHRQMSNSSPSSVFQVFGSMRPHHKACFISAIVCVFMVIFTTIFISVFTSNQLTHHLSSEDRRWYRNATFYEIFPASFKDTDSDGYGDFQGIIQKLDYISSLGMTAIRLNSIFSALDYPLEFEHIIDLRSADPHLGRMDDFSNLIRECHARGIRLVLDLNPTVTSDQHTWALHWQRGIPGYEHFYASANRSKDPPQMENSEGPPPEDWELTQRTFGAHYILNWSNEFVQKEYQKALAFWINSGVDGFYMKHLDKIHIQDVHDIPKIIHQWRKVLDSPPFIWINPKRLPKRVLIVSSQFAQEISKKLGDSDIRKTLKKVDLIDYPILIGSANEMADQISKLKEMSDNHRNYPVSMWHLGSSDTFRLASRIDSKYHMAAFYLLMSLTGSASVFYGDEIGIKDSYDVFSERVYRGGQLTPMQWKSDNSSGGFTDNMTNPWLPLNPDHFSTNVQSQTARLSDFINLLDVRQHLVLGSTQRLDVLDPNIIVMERGEGHHRFLLVVNLGTEPENKDFPDSYREVRPFSSIPGSRIRSKSFQIDPGSAFLARVRKMDEPSNFVLKI